MSSNIWTPDALSSNHRNYDGGCWRAVEAQHRISTMKLVDSAPEQELLEQIVERSKPLIPPACAGLHYLLFTPFRYGARYPIGSRFRRPGMTAGVFYGAEAVTTAVAETIFHRYLFFADSPGTPLPNSPSEYTIFETLLHSMAILDLTRAPLNRDRAIWTNLSDYAQCQDLAVKARMCGTEIIRYESVRDRDHGANLAVLDPKAFAQNAPDKMQSWHVHLKSEGAFAICEAPKMGLDFKISDFGADGRLSFHQ